MRTIPVSPDLVHQSLRVLLDGVELELDVRWNDRASAWMLTVSDDDGLVTAGRRIVVGVPLLARVMSDRLPAGELIAVDTSDTDADPGEGELGRRVELVYVTASEVAAIDAEIAA